MTVSKPKTQQAIDSCERQLLALFTALFEGRDIAPATQYRLEGYLEALVAMGLLSEDEAASLIDRAWREVFNTAPVRGGSSPLSIPVVMQRAPVFPSTKQQS